MSEYQQIHFRRDIERGIYQYRFECISYCGGYLNASSKYQDGFDSLDETIQKARSDYGNDAVLYFEKVG
jgi:hypothetical protein